jgi:radical SAM protein with 4Fe4S-binding SPASM domain
VNPPWSAQIELVEGCNRMCWFCGVNAIRSRAGDYRFMGLQTALRISEGLSRLCPNARVEFAMHGEPTVHPGLYDFIALFRQALPKAQMQLTTNGRSWLEDMQLPLDRLWDAGLDFIVMDTYEPESAALRAQASALKRVRVVDFYRDMAPKGKSIYANYHRSLRRTLILLDDLSRRSGEVRARTLTNQGGNSSATPVPEEPLERTCTNPFREISVCWNGEVNVCCNDWGHEYVCGNVNSQSLSDIWCGKPFQAIRAMLQQKRRWATPCSRCSLPSGSRSGLLPKLPEMTNEQIRTIIATVSAKTGQNGKPPWVHPALIKEVG